MNSIDLSPFYRNSIGFDRFASRIDTALTSEPTASAYPHYNIEMLDENSYLISLGVAGFSREELDLQIENGVLTVRGNKRANDERANNERIYLHQGIANRSFERVFNLADYVEVTGADLSNGLLSINLVKEIPESMKPKTIAINGGENVFEHQSQKKHSKRREKVA